MALNNIIAPPQSVVTTKGDPVAGGFVFLYEPGTTTFITSYFGADLVTPHSNPVRLSGSGRADIWITRDADMVITDRNGNTILTQDNVNPDELGGGSDSGLVPNGSFEIVTTPPVPDGWTAINEAGSTNAVDSSFSTDGANSYRFTSSGVGGGSLTTTDFFPVNDVDQLRVNFDLFSTLATVLNIVRVEWYDVSFISISNSDVYSSTANPLAWTEFQLVATPPALARFAKLRLIGIDPSVPLAGSTYFDRISVFYPAIVSGIFDNITIQNNEIITTNLNGELALKPNGDGPVNIFSTGTVDLVDVNNPLNISILLDPAVNPHLAFDQNSIQAKTDATNAAAILHISKDGGEVRIGDNLGFSIQIDPADATLNLNNVVGELQIASQPMVGSTPGAGSEFYSATTPRMNMAASGVVNLLSDGNTDAEVRRLDFTHQNGTARGRLGHGADDIFRLANLIDGGNTQIQATSSGSALRNLLVGDPDADVGLYQVGVEVARTLTAAAGGFEANNTLTGAGFERVLTVSDLGSVSYPLTPQDNEQIQWGTGNDVQQFFNGTVLRFDGDFDVEFDSNNANEHQIKILNTVAGLGIRVDSSGIAHLSELFNTGGFVGDYIDMDDADGRVLLNFSNVPVARTAAVSGAAYPYIDTTGGFLVNNNTTGTGNNERVTTYTDHMMTGGLQDDRNLDPATPVADNRLVAGATCRVGYWKFEVFATFRRTGGTANIVFDFAGSNISQCRYTYDYSSADGTPSGNGASDDAATDQNLTLGAASEEVMLRISGQFQASASTTFEFRWAPTVNQIDTVSRMSGGWMTVCPIEIL